MSEGRRARPQPTPETQHFWDGTRAGELRLQRCNACLKVYFPPRPFCPSCASRSNADAPRGASPNLPGYYAIPPGALVQGKWNEIMLHVVWSDGAGGAFQSYYRVKGGGPWTQSSAVTGIPTVQWDNALG